MPAARDGALEYYTYINTEQFKKDIREMIQGVDRVGDKTEKETKQMDAAFRKLSTAVAGYFTFQAAKGFVTKLVQIRGEFQQLNIALETMLGNKEKADALMEQIKQLAATTPFQLTDVAQGAKQLLAYGFSADTVTENLKKLGDLAAGVSAPLGDIVYLYGTMRTQGRAYAQDIRQFTNRGIPLIQKLADQFGVTTAEVSKLVSEGKVGFPQIEKAINSMTGEGGKFFNLMAKQSESLTGQISNLQDQFEFMLNDLGKSSEGFLYGGIQAASELVAHYKIILDIVEALIVAYGTYRTTLILATVAQKIATTSLEDMAIAWRSVTVAMESNPIGLVAVALSALVTLMVSFNDITKKSRIDLDDLNDSLDAFTDKQKKISDLVGNYAELSEKTHRTKEETEELRKTSNKLARLFPDIIVGIDAETNAWKFNTEQLEANRRAKAQLALQNKSQPLLEAASQTAEDVRQRDALVNIGARGKKAKEYYDKVNKEVSKIKASILDYVSAAKAAGVNLLNDKTLNTVLSRLQEERILSYEFIRSLKEAALNNSPFTVTAKRFVSVADSVKKLREQLAELRKEEQKLKAPGAEYKPDDLKSVQAKIKSILSQIALYQGKSSASIEVPIKPTIPDIPAFIKDIKTEIKSGFKNTDSLDLDSITNELFGSLDDNWKVFFNSLNDNFDSSVGQLKEKLKGIENVLKTGAYKDRLGRVFEITPAQKKGLESAAKSIKELLGITDSKGKEIKDVFGELGDVFSKLSENTDEVSSGLSGILGLLSSSAIAASSIKKGIEGVKDAIDIIKKGGGLKDIFSGGLSGLAGIATGIGAAISVVSSIVSAINKKQAEADRNRAKAIEKENDLLQHQYDLTKKIYGIEQIKAQMDVVKKAQEDRNKKAEELLKLFQGWNMAFGGTFSTDQTKEWEKSIKNAIDTKDWDKLSLIVDDIQTGALNWSESAKASFNAIKNDIELIQEATNQLRESFTGISLDSLTDDIVSMFTEGKTAAADFADTFEDLMKKSITETFKRKYLATQLQEWYKQFADFANPENGEGTLTEGEVSQLQNNLNKIISNAKTGWEQLQKAAGLDFSDITGESKDSSGLAGQIKRSITEDTATELSGRINGMYLMTKKSSENVMALLGVQKDWQQKQNEQLSLSIRHLAGIESNTFKTANNSVYLSYLKSIDNKLSNGKDAKRAAGTD